MNIILKTEQLQSMVAKAVKGAGNNRLLPITGLMAIIGGNNELKLITTDATTYLFITEPVEGIEPFYAVVSVDVFSRLVTKITSEEITLDADGGKLTISGNGKYIIPMSLDETGNYIKYPNPLEKFVTTTGSVEIPTSVLIKVLMALKPSLATDTSCYRGYYIDNDRAVATDTFTIASTKAQFGEFGERLLNPEVIDLCGLLSTDVVDISFNDEEFTIFTPDCTIYSHVMSGIEDYQIKAIGNLVEQAFPHYVTLSKQAFIQMLDRIALFVSPWDKNVVELRFTEDGISAFSKNSSSAEVIPYFTKDDFGEFECSIDVMMLITQLKAHPGNTVILWYGLPNAIKLNNEDLTQIIALSE